MKNRYSIRLLVIVFLSAFAMGICYSLGNCRDRVSDHISTASGLLFGHMVYLSGTWTIRKHGDRSDHSAEFYLCVY